jgi:hypothetical protein
MRSQGRAHARIKHPDYVFIEWASYAASGRGSRLGPLTWVEYGKIHGAGAGVPKACVGAVLRRFPTCKQPIHDSAR